MSIIGAAVKRSYRYGEALLHEIRYGNRTMRTAALHDIGPLINLEKCSGLVVVAHPDDEIIGCGILLSRIANAGIIRLTDGVPRDGRAAYRAGFERLEDYGKTREREAGAALSMLDRKFALSVNWGITDQRLIFLLVPVVRRLTQLLMANDFDCVLTHPYEGGHPDHDATALAVHAACILLSDAKRSPPIIIEMTSYHAVNGSMVYGEFLPNDEAGPVKYFLLDETEQKLKRRMFACHATQRRVLERFPLHVEQFRQAPLYDFLKPPHAGPLGYESFIWSYDSRVWRRAAARALHRLGLLNS